MSQELYKRYRPTTLEEVVGQKEAVEVLSTMIEKKKIPHAILFQGSSGCGKTSLARILREHVGCGEVDFFELNCADTRGIDAIRDIKDRMSLCPMYGSSRVYYLDEIHQCSSSAQSMLLKMLEDTPKHVYFFLATTDPYKLLKTIITRCTAITVKPMEMEVLQGLIKEVCKKEKVKLTNLVIDSIAECAGGSARQALVDLGKVIDLPDEQSQLDVLAQGDVKRHGIDLARLLHDSRTKWPEIAASLKNMEDDPEQVRHIVLGYANSVLLKGGKMAPWAYHVIQCFATPFYDTKKAGLTASCWEVIQGPE